MASRVLPPRGVSAPGCFGPGIRRGLDGSGPHKGGQIIVKLKFHIERVAILNAILQ